MLFPGRFPASGAVNVADVSGRLKSSECGRIAAVLMLMWFSLFDNCVAGERVDIVRDLQLQAVKDQKSPLGYWGTDPEKYFGWKSHSNRLIPVYTFGSRGGGAGIDLESWTGNNSPYRSEEQLRKIYGYVPEQTVDAAAVWMDQTNVYDIQAAAMAAGRKYIFLVVFDGMDWQTTQAAAIYNSGTVYQEGPGTGTHFQTYTAAGTAQYSYIVTSPHNDGTDVDVDQQSVKNPGGTLRGGYSAAAGGASPWALPPDMGYLIGKPAEGNPKHAYTDSSSSASSMTTGTKLFNGGVNVSPTGEPLTTIAHQMQERGYSVGAVTSVPICHATPAGAYAHNVSRDDYQDLVRDMLGLKSIQHPNEPLAGMDVVIGCGYGTVGETGKDQGQNYVPGNIYMADADLSAVDVKNGGRYVTAVRTADVSGSDLLEMATQRAVQGRHRLLGFFGMGNYNGHLPLQTADGLYDPVPGAGKKSEQYTATDLKENPTLAQMTSAAIDVLSTNDKGFWLMVESGDVDWANHDDNIDASIGAVNSGDAAVKIITDWVEIHSNWNESLVIVTADHGHLWNLSDPQLLTKRAP
jgi:alkaline phosphatase